MEIIGVEKAVTAQEQMRYGKDPSFFEHLRSDAARSLSEGVMRDAARYERIDPAKDELESNPFAPIRHRWTLGIERDMSAVEAREKQMDEARREGLREAAIMLRDAQALYVGAEGHCKLALVQQLHDMARQIEKRANGQSAPQKQED